MGDWTGSARKRRQRSSSFQHNVENVELEKKEIKVDKTTNLTIEYLSQEVEKLAQKKLREKKEMQTEVEIREKAWKVFIAQKKRKHDEKVDKLANSLEGVDRLGKLRNKFFLKSLGVQVLICIILGVLISYTTNAWVVKNNDVLGIILSCLMFVGLILSFLYFGKETVRREDYILGTESYHPIYKPLSQKQKDRIWSNYKKLAQKEMEKFNPRNFEKEFDREFSLVRDFYLKEEGDKERDRKLGRSELKELIEEECVA